MTLTNKRSVCSLKNAHLDESTFRSLKEFLLNLTQFKALEGVPND